MRTTLDIADDVLQAVKELGHRKKKTAGQMISDLARQALNASSCAEPHSKAGGKREEFCGFRPFSHRGKIVTNERINQLREEDAY
jgi:hypothetical protein